MPRPTIIPYALLGLFAAITATCKAIEWANYWMQQPSDRLKQR